tara:strand:+ start:9391 stop:9723 length:333 start_codon:yes stop_codon:yes gene_type:complete
VHKRTTPGVRGGLRESPPRDILVVRGISPTNQETDMPNRRLAAAHDAAAQAHADAIPAAAAEDREAHQRASEAHTNAAAAQREAPKSRAAAEYAAKASAEADALSAAVGL